MTTSTVSQQFHLIDDDAELIQGMNEFLEQNEMINFKKNYNIISIIGSQSSGKSTLLNNLFGTSFQVMQSKQRSQTTKGIFVSASKEAPILILDVEGTDSKERWDDRLFYAKSTGIFALALSQVLVINIWTNMIGNYEGQQLGIIKTIFEMNLKLFNVDQVKSIVFVLRDFHQDEDFEYITNSINSDLIKIWGEIKKPQQFENSKPTDLFKIEYIPLSSFVYNKDQFGQEVNTLKQRFVNKEDDKYFFKEFDYNQNLPLEALNDYIGNIWKTIRDNKDINLPNEKEIIAQIRCEAIKKEAHDQALPTIKQLQQKVSTQVVDNFNEIGQKAYKDALSYYEERADYLPRVVEEKKQELQQLILSELYTLFVSQMSQAKTLLSNQMDKELQQSYHGGIIANLEQLRMVQIRGKQQITSIIANSIIVNEVWDLEKFDREFDLLIEQTLDSKFGAILTKEFTEHIDNSVVMRFNQFDQNFWQNLQEDYEEQLRNLTEKFIPLMEFSEAKSQSQTSYFTNLIFSTFDHKLKEKLLNVNDHMIKKFQKIFRFNINGTPENWKSLEEDQIEDKFKNAKNQVLDILSILKFNKIKQGIQQPVFKQFQSVIQPKKQQQDNGEEQKPKALDDLDCPRLLNEVECNKIKQEFDKQIDEELQSARRAKNQTDILGIPKAVWAILIFFAYDDILRWLSNPFFMTPIVMILGAVGLAFSTGNQALIYTGVKMGTSFAQDKLKQFMK